MKGFFEEYGFIILTCVVVIALIGLAALLKDPILEALTGIIQNWSTQVNNAFSIGS